MSIAAIIQNMTPTYQIWEQHHCRVSPVSIQRFLAKTYKLLEQMADGCRLSEYWKHYKTWAHTQYLTPSGVTCINARLYVGIHSEMVPRRAG